MDRFIDFFRQADSGFPRYLKSNMDRFIEAVKYPVC